MDFGAALRQEVDAWHKRHLQGVEEEWAAKSAQITRLVVELIKKECLVESRKAVTKKQFWICDLVMEAELATRTSNGVTYYFGQAPGWMRGLCLSTGVCVTTLNANSTFTMRLRDVVDQVLPRVEAALKQQGLEVSTPRKMELKVSWAARAWAAA
mmetsp:Transcript_41972/g.135792  ORF Transcript_41972/g.135792 Transcript_41972/m.135792 type:complete len:155 (-) Transcript_41972:338-802(-)